MKLTTRFSASGFIEIKVDTIEETISKSSKEEIEQLIHNLKEVIDDLETLNN